MPASLDRVVLTVLVPGLVTITSWLLALVQHTDATLGFKEYASARSCPSVRDGCRCRHRYPEFRQLP